MLLRSTRHNRIRATELAARLQAPAVARILSIRRRASVPNSQGTAKSSNTAPIEAAIGKGNAVMMYGSAPFFGEDFALFQQVIPGAMFFLGVANEEKGISARNHFPDYDIDEEAIEIGTVAMANVLLSYLADH